jgi:hypothetical protein
MQKDYSTISSGAMHYNRLIVVNYIVVYYASKFVNVSYFCQGILTEGEGPVWLTSTLN